jgi:hypothetical protein
MVKKMNQQQGSEEGMHETGKIALNHPQYLGVPSHRNDGLVSRHALQRFEGTLF